MIVEAAVDVYNFVNAPCYCTIWTDISGIFTLFTVSLWLGGSRGLTGLHNHECTCPHLHSPALYGGASTTRSTRLRNLLHTAGWIDQSAAQYVHDARLTVRG